MPKSRPFSIYLLKPHFDAGNALADRDRPVTPTSGSTLPIGASLFVLDAPATKPWWKDCFGIQKDLWQEHKGALIFLPVQGRTFVLAFGHVRHYLNDESYEHDFGLRITLNTVDPNKLKSTDLLEPGAARRRRTQIPNYSNITAFDFDRDTSILKQLTGYTREKHRHLFKHATGSSSLRISLSCNPSGWVDLCAELLGLYQDRSYLETFPDIQSVTPVRDPEVIEQLNVRLLSSLVEHDDNVYLTIPEIVDNVSAANIRFSGAGKSLDYDDVFLDRYYEYLASHNIDSQDITIQQLKKHRLVLTDASGTDSGSFSIFRCIVHDTKIQDSGRTYHLNEGAWYSVEDSYISRLKVYLDPLCCDLNLPDYTQDREFTYNENTADALSDMICLDTTSISPAMQTQVEPCDLYSNRNGDAVFYHIKVSTFSSQLSHLFNQGANSIQLLKLESTSRSRMESLIAERVGQQERPAFVEPFLQQRWRVVFGIVTHKDKQLKSDNLPLFSRISLMRVMKEMQLMAVDARFGFIRNLRPKRTGTPRARKRK